MTLSDPKRPKLPQFVHFAPPFIASQRVNLETSNLVHWFTIASPTCRWKIFPERGVVRVRRPVLEFYTPCYISATANARDFEFCTRVGHVMSEYSISGRGQGHVSNFYIVDLENFATASRRDTGDIHNSSVVGLFMTPETMRATRSRRGWVHMFNYTLLPTTPPTSYHRFDQDLSYK